jgi:4-hydroxy-tetrahydrodipicolinate reductase
MHFGLGPIGAAVARQVSAHRNCKIVGGIDIDPDKAGRDIGEVAGFGKKIGAKVWSNAAAALRATRPDVVVLCTNSSLKKVAPQIEAVLKAGIPIVSTTEELAYAAPANRSLLRRIDQLAKRAKVAVLGTGVNPGFVMDALPITLTGVCERVDAIRIDRIQDARSRRLPFQQKIGSGLTPKEFRKRVAERSVRHVGLAESIQMIGDALGWKVDRIIDRIRPKVARQRVASKHIRVNPGQVCGIIQDGIGFVGGKPLITLHMEAYLGAPETYDAVRIDGSPALHVKVLGGTQGDIATASIVVNSIPKVLAASPGYRTMLDLPIPSFFRGQ